MRVSWRGRGGQGRSWARLNGAQPYVLPYGVSARARRATATVDGENCAQKAWPEGTREAVSRGLQGEAWAGEGDQGRARTARGRRCAYAQGAGTHRALLK